MRAIFDGIFYALASYSTTILSTIASFLVRLWVPPAVFGATSLVNGITSYVGTYNSLYRNAIDREVPVHLGQDDQDSAEDVLHASYTLLLLSACIESAVFVGVGALSSDHYLRLAWFVAAITNLTNSLGTADRITLKATIRFHVHNAALVIGTTASVVALLGLSWFWGYRGYFVALALGSLLQFVITRRALGQGWKAYIALALSSSVIKRVLSIGVAIAILGLALQLLLTVDRYFVAGYLSLTELGYYSLGSMMMVRVYTLPKALIGSYMPRMMALLGAHRLDRARYVADKLHQSSVLVSVCLSGALLLSIRPFISWLLPEYVSAIPAIEIMVWGSYLLGAKAVSHQLHIGLEKMRIAIGITVLGGLMAIGLNFALVRYGLIGVAIATNTGIGFYVLLMNWSGERILQTQGLVRWFLVGIVPLLALYSLLHFAGREIAVAWLVLYSITSGWYLSTLHGIDWHKIPNMALSYLREPDRSTLLRTPDGDVSTSN